MTSGPSTDAAPRRSRGRVSRVRGLLLALGAAGILGGVLVARAGREPAAPSDEFVGATASPGAPGEAPPSGETPRASASVAQATASDLDAEAREGVASARPSDEASVPASQRPLRVRVVDERGGAIAGASFRVFGDLRAIEPNTDESGVATLWLPTRHVGWLEVRAEGRRAERRDDPWPELRPAELVILLEAAPVVRGRVIDRERGLPVAGADVSLALATDARWSLGSTRSGSDGAFALVDCTPSRVLACLRTRASGFLGDVAVLPVGASTEHLEILLTAGRIRTGRVVDRRDRPVAGASVRRFVAYADPADEAERTTTTDPSGRFALRTPSDGEIVVLADAPGRGRGVARLVGPESEIVVRLRGSGAVHGRVRSAEASPLEAVEVRLRVVAAAAPGDTDAADLDPSPVARQTATDAAGCWRIPDVAWGWVELSFGPAASALGTRRFVLDEDDVEVPDFVRDEAAVVRGEVRDHAGRGAAAVVVEARVGAGGPPSRATITGPDGRFAIVGLAAELDWSLRARARDGRTSEATAVEPARRGVVLRLNAVRHVVLRVSSDGRPYDGALRVAALRATGGVSSTRADDEGDVVRCEGGLAPLPGRFARASALAVRTLDDARAAHVLVAFGGRESVDGTEEADLTVELVPAARLLGRALDALGRPSPGAKIDVTRYGVSRSVVADALGRFDVRGLPPGVYALGSSRPDSTAPPIRVDVPSREGEALEILVPADAETGGRDPR